jgi:hypothetical protein
MMMMPTKDLLTAAILGTLLWSVAPLAAEAGAQDEWLLRQMQVTDGDRPDVLYGPVPRPQTRYERTSIEGPAATRGTQCDWHTSQQHLTDGSSPAAADSACSKRSDASPYEGTALSVKPGLANAARQNGECPPGAGFGTAIQLRGGRLFTSGGIEISAP